MAIKDILVYPHPLLKTICTPVEHRDTSVDILIQDLIDTMMAAGHSVGVAAPQIGVTQRVLVVDVSRSKLGKNNSHGLLTMINPEILETEGLRSSREGCMSVPDYTGNVERAESVVMQYRDHDGHGRVIRANGFEATALQHEIDHLDGLLFLDRITSLKTDLFRRKKR
jgi:peptide deformylase